MGGQVIRLAAQEDLPELFRMGREFLSCTAFAHVPFDEATFANLCLGLINGGGVILVAENGASLCGMIAMVAFPHYFNASVKAAQEFFWWVDPESRGNGVAIRLLGAAEDWAREQGCATVHMLALDALNGDEVSALYARRGYSPLERTFVRSL